MPPSSIIANAARVRQDAMALSDTVAEAVSSYEDGRISLMELKAYRDEGQGPDAVLEACCYSTVTGRLARR